MLSDILRRLMSKEVFFSPDFPAPDEGNTPSMNDTGCQNEQGAPGHVMIDCLKRIIREYQNLELPGGLLPRRVAIGSLPGKVSVVNGVRGSGKTSLLRQRIRQLVESGVPVEDILSLDLADDRLYWLRHENPDIILEAYFELHPQKRGSEMVHCFFDEIQALPHWQLFINRLTRSEKCEITVAGSLLPSPEEETASPLTGRIVSWEIFPLSFREFLDGKGIESNGPLSTRQRLTIQKAFEDYWEIGGFPGVNRLDQLQRIAAHQVNWNAIIASIIGHHNISHPRAVIELAHWLVDNTGSFYAVSHLTDYLKSLGQCPSNINVGIKRQGKKMTTLVVGASGATGRLLAEQLLNRGQNVKVVVRSPDKLPEVLKDHDHLSVIQASILGLSDDEMAADYLRINIGQKDKAIEWAAVRPDSLINEDHVTEYEVYPSPTRSAIFNAGSTSRINVGHFMANLITNDDTWNRWKGQMPVIYNKESF